MIAIKLLEPFAIDEYNFPIEQVSQSDVKNAIENYLLKNKPVPVHLLKVEYCKLLMGELREQRSKLL